MTQATETTPARIRWEDNGYGGWTGYVGTLKPWAFQLRKPGDSHFCEWALTSQLPGLGTHGRYLGPGNFLADSNYPDKLMAKAESLLAGFTDSLGAVFPAPTPRPGLIAVTAPDGYLWLQCFADDPDADDGETIVQVEAGDSWDGLMAHVAAHVAGHGCGEAAP